MPRKKMKKKHPSPRKEWKRWVSHANARTRHDIMTELKEPELEQMQKIADTRGLYFIQGKRFERVQRVDTVLQSLQNAIIQQVNVNMNLSGHSVVEATMFVQRAHVVPFHVHLIDPLGRVLVFYYKALENAFYWRTVTIKRK
ncbi:MAG: hypothetical protein HY393_01800 [Candidatus Diapherotrites archaeon]|nr:hypothetical protein [Candidatus Diapherotrites archaeon]